MAGPWLFPGQQAELVASKEVDTDEHAIYCPGWDEVSVASGETSFQTNPIEREKRKRRRSGGGESVLLRVLFQSKRESFTENRRQRTFARLRSPSMTFACLSSLASVSWVFSSLFSSMHRQVFPRRLTRWEFLASSWHHPLQLARGILGHGCIASC